MEGFNPHVKPNAYGEAEFRNPANEETREFTVTERIRLLSPEDRADLLQDALERYNEMEAIIHAITSLEEKESQDVLF